MTTIYFFAGTPSAGKSTARRGLEERFGLPAVLTRDNAESIRLLDPSKVSYEESITATTVKKAIPAVFNDNPHYHLPFLTIDKDLLQDEMAHEGVNWGRIANHPLSGDGVWKAYDLLHRSGNYALRAGVSVIMDCPHVTHFTGGRRSKIIHAITEGTNVNVEVFGFYAPGEVIYDRMVARGTTVEGERDFDKTSSVKKWYEFVKKEITPLREGGEFGYFFGDKYTPIDTSLFSADEVLEIVSSKLRLK